MKIQRKKTKPLYSSFIKLENIHNNYGYQIDIFEDGSLGNDNTNYAFIISKESEKKEIINKNNIISIVNIHRKDIEVFNNGLGKAFRILKNMDKTIYDNDLIEAIKVNNKTVDFNLWESQKLIVNPNVKVEEKKAYKNKKTTYSSDDLEIRKIKPIVLLTTLNDMGVIDINGEEPNSEEVKIKFNFVNQSKYGSKKFNISVTRHTNLGTNKADVFNDFSNQKNKRAGIGSVGLMVHLFENGLGDVSKMTIEEKKETAKNFLIKQIIPRVPEEMKVEPGEFIRKINFNNKAITFQPIEKENPYIKGIMTDFLKFRGINQDTINQLIKEKNLIFGDFYNSLIVEEYNDKGELKKNYGYKNAPFFRLRSGYNNHYYGAERFQVKKNNSGKGKPFEYDKMNIGSVDGKYWAFGEQNNPSMAVLHEAIIDGLSSYELLKEMGINADKARYMSSQGASHFKKFIGKNINFWSEEVEGERKSYVLFYNQITQEINDKTIEDYKKQLGNKEFVFLDYGDTNKIVLERLNEVKCKFGLNLKIENLKNRNDFDFSTMDREKSIVLDKINFYDALHSMNLKYDYETGDLKTFYIREKQVPLNDRYKNMIKNKIMDFFKTDHLVFALDNDHAGLKHLPVLTELERHIGIKASYFVPNDNLTSNSYQFFKGLGLNEMLDNYQSFVKEQKYNEAYALLKKYISQQPEIDNNDVLKKYQELKINNPQAAKDLLENKKKQLDYDPNRVPNLKKKPPIKRKP